MSLTVAIVGCGKIADEHLDEIAKMPGLARVVAACDREGLMAEQASRRHGIPTFYDDFDRMLRIERPNVVHVTAPPRSHVALVSAALDAGAHVCVDKPLALSQRDSKELIDLAARRDRKLAVAYLHHFDPPALELLDLQERGALGDVVHAESFFGYDLGGPFGKAIMADPRHWVHDLPGKLLHNNLEHVLHKALPLLPDAAPRILATGNRLRSNRFGDVRDEFDDELRVTLAGERTTFSGTFSCRARPQAHFVRVYGSKGTAHADFVGRTVTLAPGAGPSAIGRVLPAFQQGARFFRQGARNVARFAKSDLHFFSGLHRLIRSHYESIVNNTAPPIPYADLLRLAAWLDEIFRQVPQGKAALSGSGGAA